MRDRTRFESELRALETEFDLSRVGRWIVSAKEKALVAAALLAGKRDLADLTNKVFFLRHPELRGTKLKKTDVELVREWRAIQDGFVHPLLLSGPRIGPIHGGPPVRNKLPPGAVISPLAVSVRGLRNAPRLRKGDIHAIVVHSTSAGPVSRSIKSKYTKPAVEFAVDHYVKGNGGFAHYVIDLNGTIYATADERRQAAHTSWSGVGGRKYFGGSWRPPAWWTRVWNPLGVTSPVDLLAPGAVSPNQRTIAVELVILPDYTYTADQYQSLARLVVDVARRNQLRIPGAPSKNLLGHEDYSPYPYKGLGGREGAGGGRDPGAHRDTPFFDWKRLWSVILTVDAGFGR